MKRFYGLAGVIFTALMFVCIAFGFKEYAFICFFASYQMWISEDLQEIKERL